MSGARSLLDAEIAPALASLPPLELTRGSLAAVRDGVAALPITPTPGVERADHVIDAASGVVVRVHRPAGVDRTLPCVYSMHGGGFVLGAMVMDDALLGRWAIELGCVGVSVEYRLAPEHPYPVPVEDCYAGLRWVHEHAGALGVDRDRIGLHGVSAGAGLAAGLALLARDRAEIPVAFQLLESPMLDDRLTTPSSQLGDLPVWSRESNEFGWRSYLGERYGTTDVPVYAAPARATDLAGLPPALITVGTADGFRDEDIDYATKLNQAFVPTELHVYPGAPHGFQLFTDSAVTQQAARDTDDWLRRHL